MDECTDKDWSKQEVILYVVYTIASESLCEGLMNDLGVRDE